MSIKQDQWLVEGSFLPWIGKGLTALIWLYQKTVSPLLGPRCRFYPSCSHYAQECLRRYPIGVAFRKSAVRLARCHPWHPGGVDLP